VLKPDRDQGSNSLMTTDADGFALGAIESFSLRI
jgi:hypothetical protein